MLRPFLIAGIAIAITACSSSDSRSTKTKNSHLDKPNIVFVITDDQGYGDFGGLGNPIVKTPNIDALADESVDLVDYHVAPSCSPTRAALLTGHWTNRTGTWHTIMGRSMLRLNEITLADLLRDNGYQTAMFGKWHLGDNYPYRPMDRGFDEAFYHGGGGVGQTPDFWDNAYFGGSYFRNGEPEKVEGFVTDVLFDETMKYIDKAKNNKRPFFVYLSTNAPHSPMHAPQNYADLYAGKGLSTEVQHFYGMITNIDDNVQRLRDYLRKNNLESNTIFVYTTDNGTSTGEKIFNAGMRGKKGSAYDGGHRVPFFLYWPEGGYDSKQRVTTITSYVDIVPTLLDMTGSSAPKTLAFDGVSLTPLFKGKTASWPDRILVTDSQRVLDPIKWRESAVMTQRWRLINGKALYDIQADPGQENDVAKQHPDVVARLRAFYDQWWTELEPTFGEPTAIYIGADEANPTDLTAHDWLGDNAAVPWNQEHIRKQLTEKDHKHKGFWSVNAVEAGTYRFELSRWPLEAKAAIDQDLAAGEDVPGVRAYRAHPGLGFKARKAIITVNGEERSQLVKPGQAIAAFEFEVKAGRGEIHAIFVDDKDRELGAYYLRVTKL